MVEGHLLAYETCVSQAEGKNVESVKWRRNFKLELGNAYAEVMEEVNSLKKSKFKSCLKVHIRIS
jgi:hypothetical protein